VIPDRPDRVPDSIEPLVGYRAWLFSDDLNEAALFPLSGRDPASPSPWEGANRRWVFATCFFGSAPPISKTMMERWELISSKLGMPLDAVLGRAAPHTIPGEDCSCGFYATKTLDSVPRPYGSHVILGRVQLAGKVIEYTAGYRAERARIAELIPLSGSEGSAKRLAFHLGLPLAPVTSPWMPPSAA
jgi:hypothetical protein